MRVWKCLVFFSFRLWCACIWKEPGAQKKRSEERERVPKKVHRKIVMAWRKRVWGGARGSPEPKMLWYHVVSMQWHGQLLAKCFTAAKAPNCNLTAKIYMLISIYICLSIGTICMLSITVEYTYLSNRFHTNPFHFIYIIHIQEWFFLFLHSLLQPSIWHCNGFLGKILIKAYICRTRL